MKTLFNRNTGLAAFAAVVIVGLSGLTMDRSYQSTLPRGTIEIGELESVSVDQIAFLPAVEVRGERVTKFAGTASHADVRG